MSDSPEPSGPEHRELEVLVQRAVAEQVDPVRAQLATMGRALALLAARSTRLPEVGEVLGSINALSTRLDDLGPVGASVAALDAKVAEGTAEVARLATLEQTVQDGIAEMGARLAGTASAVLSAARSDLADRLDELTARLERSVAPLAAVPERLDDVPLAVAGAVEAILARSGDTRGAQADELRRGLGTAVQHAVAQIDRARAADLERVLERVAALEGPLQHDAEDRRASADELRTSVTTTLQQALATVEDARRGDLDRVTGQLAALAEPLAADAAARATQADELRATVATSLERALATIDQARQADTATLEHAVASIEQSRKADADRLAEQLAGLAEPLTRDAASRQANADDLRTSLIASVEQALTAIEQGRKADADRLAQQLEALAEPLRADADSRQANAEELRTALTATLEGALSAIDAARRSDVAGLEAALGGIDAARASDARRLLEQITAVAEALTSDAEARQAQADELRRAIAARVAEAVAEVDAARTTDARLQAEQVAALEGRLRSGLARREQVEELGTVVATTVERAVSRIEASGTADAAPVLQQVAALVAGVAAEAQRRDEQAKALLAAVDDRLEALHAAGTGDGDAREARLTSRLEAVAADQGQALLARIDERTSTIAEIDAIPQRVVAGVHEANASAVARQVEPLVARLVEAIDELAHEGGRIEAMARGHAGGARAVEDRVATMFAEVAERAETAVDRSRARISEGQVALGGRLDAILGEMLGALSGATTRLETRLADGVDGLRAAGGHQNGALLDTVSHTGQQLLEGLADVRSTLVATGAEQVAARHAQLAAIEAVARRVDEVGPVVARALLSEVERAARSASAAEDAVASLRPEALREALGDASERAAREVQAAARRLDDALAVLADQVGHGLAAVTETQAGIRHDLAELPRPSAEDAVARLDDLRVSQAALREAVQEGAHKAELAAHDIRALRERITPHLVALAEATTRRADADQAGFDAILARLDQLLAARPRGPG